MTVLQPAGFSAQFLRAAAARSRPWRPLCVLEGKGMSTKNGKFRSSGWFGKPDRDGYLHRSWMKNQGHPQHLFDGRPVIGICNTYSDLTPCNGHFRQIAEHVKRGVYEDRKSTRLNSSH